MKLFFKMKRPGATLGGIFSLALVSVVLLCGAGSVPIENFSPQGAMQANLDAGGHNLTNVATISATNGVFTGSLTVNGTNITGGSGGASFPYTPGSDNVTLLNNAENNAILQDDANGNPALQGYGSGGNSAGDLLGFSSTGSLTLNGHLANGPGGLAEYDSTGRLTILSYLLDATQSPGSPGQVLMNNVGTGQPTWEKMTLAGVPGGHYGGVGTGTFTVGTAQPAAVGYGLFSVGAAGQFYLNPGDTAQFFVTFTDLTATAQTLPVGASFTGGTPSAISPVEIITDNASTITVTVVITGAGTSSFYSAASIVQMQ